MPDHYCQQCGEVDYECLCDKLTAVHRRLMDENRRLKEEINLLKATQPIEEVQAEHGFIIDIGV